jgi:hypothetical protein
MTISNIKNGLPNNYHTKKIHLLGLQLLIQSQYAKPNGATYPCVDGDDVAYHIL